MEKTITINDKEFRFDNNIGWTFIYRNQFNKDIIPTLMPALAGLVEIVAEAMELTGKTKELNTEDVLAVLHGDTLVNAAAYISGLEFTDFINIAWAMAKWADEKTPSPERWIRSFDPFPLDILGPEILKLIIAGATSSKNSERLISLTENLAESLKMNQP